MNDIEIIRFARQAARACVRRLRATTEMTVGTAGELYRVPAGATYPPDHPVERYFFSLSLSEMRDLLSAHWDAL